MKKYYTLLAACSAVILSSCGTQIQMTEAIPAQVNLRRGTTLYVTSNDAQLVRSFANKIATDGYYKQPGDGNITALAHMRIYDVNTQKDAQTGAASFSATTEVTSGYQRLYRERYRVSIPKDIQGHYYVEDACDTYAKDVMEDLTPHEKNFYVRVSGNSKNPDIEKGALACKAGNWEQGEMHAKQAIQTNPEDPEAYFLLGIIERYKMNYAQSTQYFQKADSLKPSGKYKGAISKNKVMERNDQYVQQQLQS